MKNPQILLRDILKIKKDFAAEGIKLPPGLVGIYGEILAYQVLKRKLNKRGFDVIYFAGQKGADIQAVKDKNKINIEVKTSRLKEDGFGWWYGAALNIKKCKNLEHAQRFYQHPKKGKIFGDFCYFDYLIFVSLNENFLNPKFYIIPQNFIWENNKLLRNKIKRFSSITHRIIVSNGK